MSAFPRRSPTKLRKGLYVAVSVIVVAVVVVGVLAVIPVSHSMQYSFSISNPGSDYDELLLPAVALSRGRYGFGDFYRGERSHRHVQHRKSEWGNLLE